MAIDSVFCNEEPDAQVAHVRIEGVAQRDSRLLYQIRFNGNGVKFIENAQSMRYNQLRRSGEKLAKVISVMPRVIVVSLLEKAAREVGGFHQVVEFLYREPPYQRATDKLSCHVYERSCLKSLRCR